MKPFIRIVRVPYEEPYHLNLIVSASNGRTAGETEIYANPDELKLFANQLREFPKQEALWEIERSGYHFRLRAFKIAPDGHAAVEVRFTNNEPTTHREVAEFSIEAVPSDFDRFADLLERFAQLKHERLEWTVTGGSIE